MRQDNDRADPSHLAPRHSAGHSAAIRVAQQQGRPKARASGASPADLAPAAVLRLADRAVDAAVGPVHRAGVRHRTDRRGRRHARVPAAARRALGPGEPLVRRWSSCSSSSARVVRGSLTVAWQVLDLRRQPGAAIIAVPLRIDDDLIMTHTAVTASLIPGIAHRRGRPRPPHPLPARDRRAQRRRRRGAARERAGLGGADRARGRARGRRWRLVDAEAGIRRGVRR